MVSVIITSSLGFTVCLLLFSVNGYVFRSNIRNKLKLTCSVTTAKDTTDDKIKEYSFVQDDLRTYAMKLHTRDQAPKEGQQKAETPFTQWEPSRVDYLNFLVDSLEVYEALEQITQSNPQLADFRSTGLERSDALREDIAWLCQYDTSLSVPPCGAPGKNYAAFLQKMSTESLPKFMCHYYNHYFAHTAGGRMIGKRMSDKLLEGKTLKFYQWDGEVKELLEGVRKNIDKMAASWDAEQKQACLEETLACFKFGGGLMVYMKPPALR